MSEAQRFLVMTAAGISAALPYQQVAEVCDTCLLSPVPGAPDWCCGAFHAAGRAIAVIDLGQYMGEGCVLQAGRLVLLDRHVGGLALLVEQVESFMLAASDQCLTVRGEEVPVWDGRALVQEIAAAFSR